MAEDLFARSEQYDAMLAQGLRLAGEEKAFFSAGRLDSLFACLPPGWLPGRILDYGCGIGDTAAALAARVPDAEVIGVDPALPAIQLASARHPAVRFEPLDRLPVLGEFDLCYVNGVLHHIAAARRGAALAALFAALASGGWLALFENNAWNPGAWLVMARIPFDRGLRPLSPWSTRRLVAAAGFSTPLLRSLFYFPRALSRLRNLEGGLGRLPLGAQFQLLARRP
jgi:SAM-dependent methyltransferase